MFKSMTAYGRAHRTSDLGSFVVEVQSVNRKFLEIQLSLPLEFNRFEPEIKKWIAAYVGRGQVYLKLAATYDAKMPVEVTPNLPLARQIGQACKQIGKELGMSSVDDLLVRMLAESKEVLHYDERWDDENAYLEQLREVIHEALEKFAAMKRTEGKTLEQDILARLGKIKQAIEEIARFAPDAVTKQRKKLKERLEEVLPGCVDNEERLLREICLYSEKVDIAEEITRFRSHLEQFEHLLGSQEISVGKTLEFVLQELGREINTIGSKCSEIHVSRYVVEVKGELERIREQIQNVE